MKTEIRKGDTVISYASKFGKSSFHLFFNRTDNGIVDIGFDDFHTVPPLLEPRALSHCSLHYVLEGRGTVRIEEKEYSVSAGWMFLLPPEIPVAYYPDEEKPWSYIWFGLDGSFAQLLSDVGFSLEAPLFRPSRPKETADVLSSMIQRVKSDTLSEYLYAKSVFMRIVSDIAAKREKELPPTAVPHRAIITEVLALIEANYRNPALSVEMLCSIVHVSHSYLCKVFLRETGITMRRAIINQRMKAAKVLLTGGKTLRDAAEACGYRDMIHFAKEFRRYTGYSPGEFRKKIQLEKKQAEKKTP